MSEEERLTRLKQLHASAVLQESVGSTPLAALRMARRLTRAELDELWASRPAPTIRETATRLWLRHVPGVA